MRFLAILVFSAVCAFAKVSVSVSVIPQAFFIQKIAGNLAEVNILVQKGKSPETYEPSLKELEKLSKSQVYFTIGMPFESAWMERFKGVNPNLKIIAPLPKDKAESTADSAKHTHDSHSHTADSAKHKHSHHADSANRTHAHKHSHDLSPKDNHAHHAHIHLPHIWLSFNLSKSHATQIKDTLCEIDSANCAIYAKNLAELHKEIDALYTHFRGVFANQKKAFLVYHPAFSLIADELGLEEIAIEQDGKEAKIAHTKEVLRLIKKHNIKVIFTQPQFSTKSAKTLAKEANLTLKTADPLAFEWISNIRDFLNEVAK
ncbi:metal ABC transporter solute-binding protein, Zn/Mn family [Helicobacter sp. 23-1045]